MHTMRDELEKGDTYWLCHRCRGKHKLCDTCAPLPAAVPRLELQRPLWFVSHWYGPCRFAPQSRNRDCNAACAQVGGSP